MTSSIAYRMGDSKNNKLVISIRIGYGTDLNERK